jgi:tetratricopeptide (TPR) repeat protein
VTNAVAQGTNVTNASSATNAAESNEAIEKEFQKLMADDDAAQVEVDQWIRENNQFAQKGAGAAPAELRQRIQKRFDPVRKAYEDFLQRHPRHSRARVAYASFLGDIKDEDGAEVQLEKALEYDTNNPAIYNNLANIYGHVGDVKKAFDYYTRAIQLNPLEPVYYHNFGTTVYLFRTDAKEYYGITEEQVFAKAFELYSNAMRLDPENFPLASDIAQSYYGMRPMHTEEALRAWTNALHLAHDEIEREGVYIHFARIKLMAGRFVEAHAHLNAITNEMYLELKKRLLRNLDTREHPPKETNAPPQGTSISR